MESLEALIAHIQGLFGSGEELAHLRSLLKQADDESLRAHSAGLLPFLSQLDPNTQSLGFLYLLYATPPFVDCQSEGARRRGLPGDSGQFPHLLLGSSQDPDFV